MRIYDINPGDGTVIDPAGREAPLDSMRGTPRVPRGATNIEPPATGANEAARWAGDAWEVVADWRGHAYWLDDGSHHEITELGEEPPAEALDEAPPGPIEDLAARQLSKINAEAKKALADIRRDYPQFEIDTWGDQEREARAWAADNSVETPTLSGIAAERGVSVAELAPKVIIKANIYRPMATAVIGKRQRLEDVIKAAQEAEDREEIQAVVW